MRSFDLYKPINAYNQHFCFVIKKESQKLVKLSVKGKGGSSLSAQSRKPLVYLIGPGPLVLRMLVSPTVKVRMITISRLIYVLNIHF